MKHVILIVLLLNMVACGRNVFEGPQGNTGVAGPAGPKGANAAPCSVTQVAPEGAAPNGGALVSCNGESVLILNGASGQNGTNGLNGQDAPPTAYTITGVIDPCGTQGQFDEVFLVLANGSAIASFSGNTSGYMTRLWEVRDGVNLMTTDDTGCIFSLQTVGHVRTISWNGGSKSWPTTN